jgi:hypothetical protein
MPFGWAAGAAALGSVGSALIGSNAAGSAASTQANAANQASNTELQMFNTQQQDLAPYQAGGTNALASLQKLLGIGAGGGGATSPLLQMLGIGPNGQATGGGINPSTFQGSPGYQYGLQQGTQAVTNSAAASGGLGGNALKALQSTGQGLANQNWQQYLSNVNGGYQGLVGNLSNLSGLGESAAAGAGAGALSTGGQIGSNQILAGNNMAAGTMGSANATAGGLNGLLSSFITGNLATGGGGGGLASLFGGAGSPVPQTSMFGNQTINTGAWPGG